MKPAILFLFVIMFLFSAACASTPNKDSLTPEQIAYYKKKYPECRWWFSGENKPAGLNEKVALVLKSIEELANEKETPILSLPEKQKKFKDLLTGATLDGHFTLWGKKSENVLSKDSYKIKSATPTLGDYWVLQVHIKYGKIDGFFPFFVKVLWVGDTPVITVNNLPTLFAGTYNARVVFSKGQYAGVWDGGSYGGQLFGKIIPGKKK